jgi:hypothetical protein
MPERWIVLPDGADEQTQAGFSHILAVHAALLPNGKVLYFGGSQHLYDATLHSVNSIGAPPAPIPGSTRRT